MKTILIAAMTVDGFIARNPEESSLNWTSPEDKKWYRNRTKQAGVMVMGRTTFDTIGKALPDRRMIVYTSRSLNVDNVEATKEEPSALLARLEADGHEEIMICGGSHIYDLFLSKGLVDEIYLTVEPKLFGTGIALLQSSQVIDLSLLETSKLNDDTLLLKYEVKK